MGVINSNFRKVQVRKRALDWFEPALIHMHTFPPLSPPFSFDPLQLSGQKNYSEQKKYYRGIYLSLCHPPTPRYTCTINYVQKFSATAIFPTTNSLTTISR